MATTRIMPLHVGKGRTESRAISDIIDYVANPQKTDNGKLITSYACDSRTADAEFLLAKRQYIATILERYFKSKYVIFEFKNYNKPITQKEIYTTEKYLYAKALRSVGIIIAAHGYDENAYWAAKGCLRENGKLIILLDTDDLIEMNKLKQNSEDPSIYLLDKLDVMLSELEK